MDTHCLHEQPKKNPHCPYVPGSLSCLDVTWPPDVLNCCRKCPWWDEFDPERLIDDHRETEDM